MTTEEAQIYLALLGLFGTLMTGLFALMRQKLAKTDADKKKAEEAGDFLLAGAQGMMALYKAKFSTEANKGKLEIADGILTAMEKSWLASAEGGAEMNVLYAQLLGVLQSLAPIVVEALGPKVA
jgi:hypothetical protein